MPLLKRSAMLIAVAVLTLSGCADSGRNPTSPTQVTTPGIASERGNQPFAMTSDTMAWECGAVTLPSQNVNGWIFEQPAALCSSPRNGRLDVAAGAVTVAPGNFRAAVSGNTVRLDWDRVLEAVVSHQIEAGSAPGLSNLAVFNTGSASTTLNVTNVPAGVYFARVRAIGPDNVPGPPSNEITVNVGSCGAAPGPPAALTAQVNGNQVTLSWTPAGGEALASAVVEAGSGPGLANIVVFDTGNATPSVSAVAPNGVYYVRVRGRNACGVGGASNEVIVQVPGGGTTPPPSQDAPWTPPPVPDPPGPPPPMATLVPEVQVSAPVAEAPRIVVGPPPRPEAGAGPPVDVALVASPTSTTRRIRISSTQPVDTVILAGDTRVAAQSLRVDQMAVAESFYLIRLASPQTVVELTVTVAQSFTGQIAARLGAGPVGSYKAVPLTNSLGTGALRATLTWDTTNDIDLHVIEPDGTHVYYASRTGRTASLDVDDVNGFGPENIFVPSGSGLPGIYQVYIDHFSGSPTTTSTITITVNAGTAAARSATFTRTTSPSARTVSVANVNVLTGEIISVATARLTTGADRPPKATP